MITPVAYQSMRVKTDSRRLRNGAKQRRGEIKARYHRRSKITASNLLTSYLPMKQRYAYDTILASLLCRLP